METKKSNRANLEKKRSMFFQVGLLLALGLALVAFEWQVALHVSDMKWEPVYPADVIDVTVPQTFVETPPPPAPPQPSFLLDIVDNTVDIGDVSVTIANVDEWGYYSNILTTAGLTPTIIVEVPDDIIFSPVEAPALFNGKPAEDAFKNMWVKT